MAVRTHTGSSNRSYLRTISSCSFQNITMLISEQYYSSIYVYVNISCSTHSTRPAQDFPASQYWGINQSIRYGLSTNILSGAAGIVDSGTFLVLIATGTPSTKTAFFATRPDRAHVSCLDALERYRLATGAVLDQETGLLRITQAQFAKLESLFFEIGGVRAPHCPQNLTTLLIRLPLRSTSSSQPTHRSFPYVFSSST